MKKLDPFGRIQLVPYIQFLASKMKKETYEIHYLPPMKINGIEVFQFQIIDYLYYCKFINFEITKN